MTYLQDLFLFNFAWLKAGLRSRSRQNFDPQPEPPKSRAAPQPWLKEAYFIILLNSVVEPSNTASKYEKSSLYYSYCYLLGKKFQSWKLFTFWRICAWRKEKRAQICANSKNIYQHDEVGEMEHGREPLQYCIVQS